MKLMNSRQEISLEEAAARSGLKEEGIPTHKVSFYGLRCYYNAKHDTIWTRWDCFGFLIEIIAYIHISFNYLTRLVIPNFTALGFPLKILDEYRTVCREGRIDIESRRECESNYEDKDQAA